MCIYIYIHKCVDLQFQFIHLYHSHFIKQNPSASHLLAQALSPAHLQHELARQMRSWRRFQGAPWRKALSTAPANMAAPRRSGD